MTTSPHEVRNWLHQLLSSIEAAMPEVTAHCFSRKRPLEVVTPFPGGTFSEWRLLSGAVHHLLDGLPPGGLRYRLIENITINGEQLPPEITLPVEITWRIALFRRGETTMKHLDCAATLIREETELAAVRLVTTDPVPEPEDPPAPDQSE